MLSWSVFNTGLSGGGVTSGSASIDDLEGLAQTQGVLNSCLTREQDGMLSWRLDQDREALQRILARSDERRAAIASAHAILKKDEIVAKVAEVFYGSGYPPDLRITAPAAGAYVVTEAGCDAIAA